METTLRRTDQLSQLIDHRTTPEGFLRHSERSESSATFPSGVSVAGWLNKRPIKVRTVSRAHRQPATRCVSKNSPPRQSFISGSRNSRTEDATPRHDASSPALLPRSLPPLSSGPSSHRRTARRRAPQPHTEVVQRLLGKVCFLHLQPQRVMPQQIVQRLHVRQLEHLLEHSTPISGLLNRSSS